MRMSLGCQGVSATIRRAHNSWWAFSRCWHALWCNCECSVCVKECEDHLLDKWIHAGACDKVQKC